MVDRRRMANDQATGARKNIEKNGWKKTLGTDEKGEYLNLLWDYRNGHLAAPDKIARFKHLELIYGKR